MNPPEDYVPGFPRPLSIGTELGIATTLAMLMPIIGHDLHRAIAHRARLDSTPIEF